MTKELKFISFFVINSACITHHFRCPQMSQTALKSLEIAELSGLRLEPRWGAQGAPRPPALRAAAGVARSDAWASHGNIPGPFVLFQKKPAWACPTPRTTLNWLVGGGGVLHVCIGVPVSKNRGGLRQIVGLILNFGPTQNFWTSVPTLFSL